jgi:hypothetical protein
VLEKELVSLKSVGVLAKEISRPLTEREGVTDHRLPRQGRDG